MHKQQPKNNNKIQNLLINGKDAVTCAALGMRTFTKNSSKEDLTDEVMASSNELLMG